MEAGKTLSLWSGPLQETISTKEKVENLFILSFIYLLMQFFFMYFIPFSLIMLFMKFFIHLVTHVVFHLFYSFSFLFGQVFINFHHFSCNFSSISLIFVSVFTLKLKYTIDSPLLFIKIYFEISNCVMINKILFIFVNLHLFVVYVSSVTLKLDKIFQINFIFFPNFTFLASYYKIACGLSLETVSYDSCDQIRGTVVFAHPVCETCI